MRRDNPGERASERLVTAPFVSVTVTAFIFFFFYIGSVLVVVPRFIEDELGYGEFGVGLAVASFAIAISLLLMSAIAEPWALWIGAGGMGLGMAFLYPSLMANVVNRVADSERASALSSFTMFFELGTILGGVALGAVGQIFSKQAGFLGGAVVAALGIAILWQRVVAAPDHPAPSQLSKNSALANS